MKTKNVPIDLEKAKTIAAEIPTPFHIYCEAGIRAQAARMIKAFSWVQHADGSAGGYRNYFAVKALPNPHVMRILHAEGMGFDCSSYTELLLCEKIGVTGENIMFTSNDTAAYEFKKAFELGAVINLDDFTHIDYLEKAIGRLPELISFRYNPGPLREGNAIIGKPEEAKYGLTRPQILEAYRVCRERGVKRFALHTMIASNELDPNYFVETARMLFELAAEIYERTGVRIESVNMGGGIGIPYRPGQQPVDLEFVSAGVKKVYEEIVVPAGLAPLRVTMENGRVVVGPYGWLVTRVLHKKETYKTFIGTDATMANLMRPGMYGAYHHITVLGKEASPETLTCDVTGSLCENNDKFAVDRAIPETVPGDYLAIHDTGAHGHAMGFNYNGKLRSAEVLLRPDGSWLKIRRAETTDDLFATLDFADITS